MSNTSIATVRKDQVTVLKSMIDRAEPRPLNATDRCDRCGAAAQSVFHFTFGENPLMFCGYHTRMHLDVLLDKLPVSFWIDKDQLFAVSALAIPEVSRRKSGDGLTDA